jgi:hypothetical protein
MWPDFQRVFARPACPSDAEMVSSSGHLRPLASFSGSCPKDGGQYWDRTSDPYDVNVVLYR